MNMTRMVLAIVVIVLCFLASASLGRTLISTRTTAPTAWRSRGPASASASVSFLLALKQRNVQVLNQISTAVSNPRSALYRSFWSRTQIQDLVSPPAETTDLILKSLRDVGIEEVNNLGDAIDGMFTFPVLISLFFLFFFVRRSVARFCILSQFAQMFHSHPVSLTLNCMNSFTQILLE